MRLESIIKLLGGGTEKQTPRNGLLSSRAEWHSLSVGLFVGMVVALNGGKDGAWMMVLLGGVALGAQKVNVGHLKDVQREPAYSLIASVVGFVVTAFVILPHLPTGVF